MNDEIKTVQHFHEMQHFVCIRHQVINKNLDGFRSSDLYQVVVLISTETQYKSERPTSYIYFFVHICVHFKHI